jgi:hypothetical protein
VSEHKLEILGRHNPLYTLLFISSHLLSPVVDTEEKEDGIVTYQNPSLAILYEPSHHLVVVVADDVDFQMGILAGRNCQIALGLVVGRGEVGRCAGG